MGKYYRVNLNTVRNLPPNLTRDQRFAETRRSVKLLLVPRNASDPISDELLSKVVDGAIRRRPPWPGFHSRI